MKDLFGFKKNLDHAVGLAKLYPNEHIEGYFKSVSAFCKMMIWIWGSMTVLYFGAIGLFLYFNW